VWFPSGASFLDGTATSSWMLTLASHETAHLYQLDARSAFPAALTSVLGNSPMTVLFVLPVWLAPNIMTPTFLLEGNAVLQESRINMGGRLHSGEARALVLAQIQAGQIDANRLINEQFRFPFGQVPYLQGGYFQAHLAGKHGIDKTNQFFLKQGEHWLWPFILNKTFRDHFGASYPQEIREYTRGMESLAKKQRFTPATPLLSALFVAPMNHDADRIWFLSTNGVENPDLRVFDKKTKTVTTKQLNIPLGKMFFDGNKPLVSDSQQNDLHHITFSLYGEGEIMDERYKGQVVTDQRAGKTAAMDATHGWMETPALIDGVPYDITHSSVILDDAGGVYYFRQNGAQRVLYRNREPVFKFDGFYGKPLEVKADGTIYFIGATDYGSTLFRYKNKEISRILTSDRVVDARSISDKEFLVTEVGADTHTIHVVTADVKSIVPATYSYGFANENVIPQKSLAPAQIEHDEIKYNAIGALRYSSIELATSYSNSPGFGGSILASFNDPLEYNTLAFGYFGTQFRDRAAAFSYIYKKWLPDFGVTYRYKEEWWERSQGHDQLAYNQDVALSMKLPLLRHGQWDASLLLALTYEFEDLHNDTDDAAWTLAHPHNNEEFYGIKSAFQVTRNNSTSLGMYPWNAFGLRYTNHLQTQSFSWEKDRNTSLATISYDKGFPMEFYAGAEANVAWAETKNIDLEYNSVPSGLDTRIPMLTGHKEYTVKNAESARLEVRKVFNVRGYSPRIFVGIDRIAPFVVAQGVFLDDDIDNKYPQNIFEWGAGADIQILLAHRLRTVMRFMQGYNTTEPDKPDTQVNWSLKQSF
jgi:hypothetical protein